MDKYAGLTLHLYTTKKELDNLENGIRTITGWTKDKKPDDAIYHISVPANICRLYIDDVLIDTYKYDLTVN